MPSTIAVSHEMKRHKSLGISRPIAARVGGALAGCARAAAGDTTAINTAASASRRPAITEYRHART
jgi:hypothetical protein